MRGSQSYVRDKRTLFRSLFDPPRLRLSLITFQTITEVEQYHTCVNILP